MAGCTSCQFDYFKAIGNGFKTVWKGVDHTPYSPSSDGPALSAQLNNEKPTTEGRTVRTPNGKQQIGRIGGHGFYIDSTSVKSTFLLEIEAALD